MYHHFPVRLQDWLWWVLYKAENLLMGSSLRDMALKASWLCWCMRHREVVFTATITIKASSPHQHHHRHNKSIIILLDRSLKDNFYASVWEYTRKRHCCHLVVAARWGL